MKDLVVIKVGTGVLTRENGTLDGGSLVRLVTGIAELHASGQRCLLVSSGAVGAGVSALKLDAYPKKTAARQAAAAVGQARLMESYRTLFRQFDLNVAQLLLSGPDFQDNRKHVAATMTHLLDHPQIIPIINENDSVAVDELRVGDNDMLSTKVAELMEARLLILLTTVDGVLDRKGQLIEKAASVAELTDLIRGDESGKFSIGGMASKLKAVDYALSKGIEVVIANGRLPNQLPALAQNQGSGTWFDAKVQ